MDASSAPTPPRDLSSTAAVLVVSPDTGELRELARRAAETWRLHVARDRAEALLAAKHASLALAVVPLHLGGEADDGLELCLSLKAIAPELRLVLVTPLDSSSQRVRALRSGVEDCVPRPIGADELHALVAARLRVIEARGEQLDGRAGSGPRETRERVIRLTRAHGLSPREAEMLSLIARGAHAKAAAARLGCGYSTARTHLRRLARKLGCASPREVLSLFFDRDLRAGE